MEEKTVEICRELAMSIWTKTYGKATKVKDFAGREMDKSAYDQRGSKFGWNLDHILPKSRGGKDTESNLICCHILTNDEKADKYPCFSANGKQFEIVKVENHYEIREKKGSDSSKTATADKPAAQADEGVNFFDSAAGIRCYGELDTDFFGTVTVKLKNPKRATIVDFIKELFDGERVSATYRYSELNVRVKGIRLPTKESMQELLDKCVTLNTYLKWYFIPKGIASSYQIFCGAHTQTDELKNIEEANRYAGYLSCPLMINELVKINTSADKKLKPNSACGWDTLRYESYEYDYWWTKLAENLKKALK